jgi:hypothetical protein
MTYILEYSVISQSWIESFLLCRKQYLVCLASIVGLPCDRRVLSEKLSGSSKVFVDAC